MRRNKTTKQKGERKQKKKKKKKRESFIAVIYMAGWHSMLNPLHSDVFDFVESKKELPLLRYCSLLCLPCCWYLPSNRSHRYFISQGNCWHWSSAWLLVSSSSSASLLNAVVVQRAKRKLIQKKTTRTVGKAWRYKYNLYTQAEELNNFS